MQNYRKWITKYRKKVLTGEVAIKVRELIREICKANDIEILKGHVSKDHVKQWVVNNSKVNNPHKKYWSAAVTIGYDYCGKGDTIEQAYNDMTDQIMKSPFIMSQLFDYDSFKGIVRQ